MPDYSDCGLEFLNDARTFWVNGPGGLIARFGVFGIDIHLAGSCEGGYCTHEVTTIEDWEIFKQKMLEIHNVVVSDEYRPGRLAPPGFATKSSMTLESIKARAFKMRPDLPMRTVIDRLASLWTGPLTVFNPEDMQLPLPEVHAAFLLLVHEPLYVLRGRWVFNDGEEEYPIGYLALEKALSTGAFQHPKTGAPVADWMRRVGVIYESGQALDAAMAR